jgi:hypothetical protein
MADGEKSISLLQSRHVVIISGMKLLILMLLIAVSASAQNPTVADVARQARAQKGTSKAARVYTTEDIRTTPAETAPAEPDKATPATEPAAAAAETAPSAATPADPLQQWVEKTEKLRAHIRELMDQELVIQLEINQWTNEVYSPDTNLTARERALAGLDAAQKKLVDTRGQISKSRLELQALEQQGPPKK